MKLTYNKLTDLANSVNFYFDKSTVFIETGTYKGETCLELRDIFDLIFTIEIVPSLYSDFQNIKPINVSSHLGNSIDLLSNMYNGKSSVIFWLDGHYVKDFQRMSDLDVPLLDELKIIMNDYKQNVLILIDDVRLFNTNIYEDWSHINKNNILNSVSSRVKKYNILNDVMAINLESSND